MSLAAHQQSAAEQSAWTLVLPRLLPSLFAADEPASGKWWYTERFDTAHQRKEQRSLCTLLQVSKALQEAVRTHCKGQLSISATPRSLKQAESFASWLMSPGMVSGLHMVKSLHLDFSMPKKEPVLQHDGNKDGALLIVEMQALVAQALTSAAARIVQTPAPATDSSALATASASTAAAAPVFTATPAATGGQPPLCKVEIREPSACLVDALALSGCQMTRLKLGFGRSSKWSHNSMQQLGEALQSLTGLKTLALLDYDDVADEKGEYMGVDDLIPSLSGLDKLTSLVIQDYDTSLDLSSQLQALTYSGFDIQDNAAFISAYDSESACVVLSSLTSLTQLTYYGGRDFDPTGEFGCLDRDVLHYQDVLPPNLLELHVPRCTDLRPVLDCSALQTLHLERCQATDEELLRLSVLTSLAEVNVKFCPDERCPASDFELCYAAESSNAWASIPLRSLGFDVDLAAAACDQSNANTSLEVCNARNLLCQLGQLGHQTGLTQLVLGVQLEPSEAPGVFMQLGLLADPLKQLSSLQELTICITKCRLPPAGSSRDPVYHALSEATASSAIDKGSCQVVAQVIAALKDLRQLRLNGLPTDFAQLVEEKLRESGNGVKLELY